MRVLRGKKIINAFLNRHSGENAATRKYLRGKFFEGFGTAINQEGNSGVAEIPPLGGLFGGGRAFSTERVRTVAQKDVPSISDEFASWGTMTSVTLSNGIQIILSEALRDEKGELRRLPIEQAYLHCRSLDAYPVTPLLWRMMNMDAGLRNPTEENDEYESHPEGIFVRCSYEVR